MNEEEKGFVIKDRRAFDQKGDLKETTSETVEKADASEEPRKKTQTERKQTRQTPLPEVNFNSLIFSLSSTALIHLGEIEDPHTGQKKEDYPLAKHAIDTVSMLKEKTKGNLTEKEQQFLDSVLTDLKLRYVKAAK